MGSFDSLLKQDLPEDVVVQILSKLPVKSLMKFSCVCKSWYAFLKNPIFIKLHSNHQSLVDNNYYLLTHYHPFKHETYFSSLCTKTRKVTPLVGFTSPGKLEVVSSCNGLVCVTKWEHYTVRNSFMLLNPALQEHYIVPVYNSHQSYMGSNVCVGFEFAENKGFKIVRIVKVLYDFWEVNGLTLVDVFSSNKNSWKRTQIDTEFTLDIPPKQVGVILKNSFFFFAADNVTIVSFDLVNETFTTMRTSPMFLQPNLCYLDVWEDHLAILCYYERLSVHHHYDIYDPYDDDGIEDGWNIDVDQDDNVDNRIDVWIMREDNSWTKECCCHHNHGLSICRLSRRANNRNVFLFYSKKDIFYVYDKDTNTFRVLDIPDRNIRSITGYKESLITVKREKNRKKMASMF